MLRMFAVGEEEEEATAAAADFDGTASAAAGIDARPRADRSVEEFVIVP